MSHHDMRNARGGGGEQWGKKSDGLVGFDSFRGISTITMETWGDYQKYYYSSESLRVVLVFFDTVQSAKFQDARR